MRATVLFEVGDSATAPKSRHYGWQVAAFITYVGCGSTGQTGKRQKVVVLRELQRAIIYTTR